MARTPDNKRNRSVPEMLGDMRRPRPPAETGWHRVGADQPDGVEFQNDWTNAASTGTGSYAPAMWYLSESGEVRLRGHIEGGAEGTIAFQLPEECRPEYSELYVVPMEDTGYAKVQITVEGLVIIQEMTP